jgi:hypothetical protein
MNVVVSIQLLVHIKKAAQRGSRGRPPLVKLEKCQMAYTMLVLRTEYNPVKNRTK